MKMKLGVAMVVLLLSIAFIPTVDADAGERGWYGSQLDANGSAVYDAMKSAFDVSTGDSVSIDVTFDRSTTITLFPDEESAKKAAKDSALNAIAAAYYDMPLAIWLWNYPVTPVEVTVTSAQVIMDGNTYHVAATASFTLTVSEAYVGKVEVTLNAVKDAAAKLTYTGNDAEKARSITNHLRGVTVIDSPEGRECDVYDALVLKKSSSAGIAAAFTYIAKCNSVEAVTVHGLVYKADSEEGKSTYWNNVRYMSSWYAVDMTANIEAKDNVCLMVGSDTLVKESVFSTTHKVEVSLQGSTGLNAPALSRLAYTYPVEFNFIDQYGLYIVAGLMVLVILVVMFKSIRDGTLK